MQIRKLIILIMLLAALAVSGISFLLLKATPDRSVDTERLDKVKLVYKRADGFVKKEQYDKAIGAFVEVVNRYPESDYAEKSLKTLGDIYERMNDCGKAIYYYTRFLQKYPDSGYFDKVRLTLEKLKMQRMMSPTITPDSIEYTVESGDTLYDIAKRFNTTVGLIKKVNGLASDIIRIGQKLKIIVSEFSIFVDKHCNILVLKKDGDELKTYRVSTGKDNSTPVGTFKIQEKLERPLWYKVGAVVSPDSDEYELGERWMGISADGYGIHGTSDETTIGAQVTQGCIRMKNAEVIELFDMVPSGTEVEIVNGVKPLEKPAQKTGENAGKVTSESAQGEQKQN